MSNVVMWSDDMPNLGPVAIAIGVFDGVHRGHRALLDSAVRSARLHRCRSVALTFDRDPDQVLHPEAAMPSLLTLEQRIGTLASTGVDTVLVVPFTPELAATPPVEFLDRVLSACCSAREIHVGYDFRFGAKASGHLDTLQAWGIEHGAEVTGHDLLEVEDQPVTSTRIRRLVAHGEVDTATELLGARPRITGLVHHGRGKGAALGFATANVTPVEHAALPGDGVYAGLAILSDGTRWPAAISIGTPPTFPDARDYVEAHLVGFTGDIYESPITLEFIQRLRDLQAFADTKTLTAAIARDVEDTIECVDHLHPLATVFVDESEREILVDDPDVLEAAERAVAEFDDQPDYQGFDDSWVTVFGPHRLSSLFSDAGSRASLITGPLTASGIPYVWQPYPPDLIQSARPDFNWQREFSLLVPPQHAREARSLIEDSSL